MTMDFAKAALVLTTFAAHIHSVTISSRGFTVGWGWGRGRHDNDDDDDDDDGGKHGGRHHNKDRDDAIKAFLIIAFLLYLLAFLLQVISHTSAGDLKVGKKILGIILFILLIVAGLVLHPQPHNEYSFGADICIA